MYPALAEPWGMTYNLRSMTPLQAAHASHVASPLSTTAPSKGSYINNQLDMKGKWWIWNRWNVRSVPLRKLYERDKCNSEPRETYVLHPVVTVREEYRSGIFDKEEDDGKNWIMRNFIILFSSLNFIMMIKWRKLKLRNNWHAWGKLKCPEGFNWNTSGERITLLKYFWD